MLCIFVSSITTKNTNKMKTTALTLKEKVINLLIKWGSNPNDVIEMVDLHFDYASKQFDRPAKIADLIRVIY